jgi:D-galactose 1-dehydrogenase
MSVIRIAIVGLGKIARDQHVAAIAGNAAFELVGVASPHSRLPGVPHYPDVEALLTASPQLSALALCTTPQVRYSIGRQAIEHGRHVLLEKPPGATVSEVLELARLAARQGVALFAAWHSRYACAVEPARAWLATRAVHAVHVNWKEDVRVWHPGQAWIWRAGGLGVFDPGINALSILTHIIPGALMLRDAELSFPANCQTPVAARLQLASSSGAPVSMALDFLQPGPPSWDIDIDTDAGRLTLKAGGTRMQLNGRPVATPAGEEYPTLYAQFAQRVRERRVDADVAPLQLVADAFLCGRRIEVAPFIDGA